MPAAHGGRMTTGRRVVLAAFLAALAGLPLAATAAPAPPMPGAPMPPDEGPTLPATTATTVVTVYQNDVWSYTEGARRYAFAVPSGEWSRVVLQFTIEPAGDPWDRLFGVAVAGVEVLRGTTPRVPMTIRQDVTRYAALMPAGATVDTLTMLGTWVGALRATLRVEFYGPAEPTAAAVEGAHERVVGAFLWNGHCANGARLARAVEFPASPPSSAIVELTTTGHGGQLFIPPPGPSNSWSEEFWYAHSPRLRTFHVLVDGIEVGEAVAMPYAYALAGFSEGGGGSTNTLVWWTAQRALNLAGVHTGAGEIPPYRIALPPTVLPLLTGQRTVELYAENGACVWISSVAFLLDA